MANVLHKTNFSLYRKSVHTPDYSTEEWIINPDFTEVGGKYNRDPKVNVNWMLDTDVASYPDLDPDADLPLPYRIIEKPEGERESEVYCNLNDLSSSNDYQKDRMNLKMTVESVGFDNLSEKEKELSALHCLFEPEILIPYYMSKGLDVTSASIKYLVNRSNNIQKAADSCKTRSNSAIMIYIAIKFMEEIDALMFMDAVKSLVMDYEGLAHLGLEYGHSREGIMDYIESTNAYSGSGLANYDLRDGVTHEQCINEFKQYLVYGIEPAEFNLFSV